jgi:hypothetical protein
VRKRYNNHANQKPKTNNSQKPSEANGQSQKPKAKSQVSMQMKDFSPKIQQIERRTAPQTKKHQKKQSTHKSKKYTIQNKFRKTIPDGKNTNNYNPQLYPPDHQQAPESRPLLDLAARSPPCCRNTVHSIRVGVAHHRLECYGANGSKTSLTEHANGVEGVGQNPTGPPQR